MIARSGGYMARECGLAPFASPEQAERPVPFLAQWDGQVRHDPGAVALVHEGREVTRGELDTRARHLAAHLRALGVAPEVRVGVCLERTPDLVAALLAVARAGGAYVPLEPHFPPARIAGALRDAGARVLLGGVPGLAPVQGLRVVNPAALAGEAAGPAADHWAPPHPEALSHVIYTSGSTGTPKGVMVRNGAVAALLDWMRARFPMAPGERVLASTSVSFDVHVAEIHFALAAGAPLCLVRDALALAEPGAPAGVAHACMVPGAARELLRAGALPPGLRRLNLAGEAVPADLARDLYRAGVAEVHNLYGPTEDTTYSTHAHLPADARRVTIGRPFTGRRAYVLDPGLRPAPEGVEGALYLAGDGTARGYVGRPASTASSFVPDPFGPPGARMYATDDRARLLAGGELEFLGRRDHQVKVRGYRVELGEVEARLREHPAVGDAVVVAAGDGGSARLAAYVSVNAQAAPAAADLAAFVGERLPAYMVPLAFVPMAALPRTASGKVDRAALPAPAWGTAGFPRTAPRTPTEAALAALWAEVLEVESVGVETDFFEAGGHSLLGMQVMARVRQRLGAALSVRALFDAPRLDAFAAVVDAARGAPGTDGQPPLEPVGRDEPLPLSFAQQRLWFLQQLQPDSPFYNIPAAVRMRGPVNAAALRRALEALVSRHEALRTTFAAGDGHPVQVVRPVERFELPVHDLAHVPAEAREAALAALARAEAARRFHLDRDPMLRAALVRLAPAEHVLLLNLHHAAGDGWSMGVLFHELSVLYGAIAGGREPVLPRLPVQYADYAVWQRRWLTDEVLEAQLAYWRGRLGSAPPALELPTDRPRPAVQTHRGGLERHVLGRPLTDRLHAFARSNGATLYMTLLAGLNVLLHRWSGQDDIVVGSPTAGRVRRELEGLIGFFVNTMVLRMNLRGDPSFAGLVRRAREAALDAYAHQDLPFERIVEELQPERSLSREPLFQVSMVLQNAPAPPLEMAGLTLELEPLDSGTSKFDLALEFTEGVDGLTCRAEYAADLWDAASIGRMLRQLEQVLDAATAHPSLPLSRIPLLPAGELAAVAAWADGGHAAPWEPAHRAFERVAARAPHAPALLDGGRSVSFGELNARANRMARVLRARGVGAESAVGIFAERTPETVAAILGVLKAGGAYVPLDPRYPAARVEYMARQSGARVVIADPRTLDRLPATGASVIPIDELWAASGNADDMGMDIDPRTLAYVIYTSGSTGLPKGVGVPHGALSAYLGWAMEMYACGGKGAPVHSPLAFDLTVSSLWLPLLRGEPVMLVPDAEGAEGLAAALRAHATPSLVKLTPTHLSLLRNGLDGDAGRFAPRAFVIGGESLEGEVAAFWGAYAPDSVLFNEYGPTEATVGCCVHRVPAGAEYAGAVPIGRPTPGTRLYVLDGAGQPVPIGVPGELHIGGAQLARGYLGRPGATAEKFIPDPLGAVPGARLYATGDRVRWRADGTLEFLGRLDDMVKIRGFRIEPAEVESVLAQHPEVSDAAVDVRPDAAGEPRLVGYVVPAPEPEDAPAASTEPDAQVTQWEAVFEGMYGGGDTDDVTFNIVGWNSSYTGAPLPADEMREWVDATADRILSLRPRRVLELGVGSGLFLFRVAPHADLYVGADLSPRAIEKLHDALPRSGLRLPPVRLMARPADDLSGLEPRGFDTVIINSVAQYFPSPAYLARVLEGAVDRVRDGGAVFVGDVRSLATLHAFHAGSESARMTALTTAADLRARMARRAEEEEELVLDPRFFAALRARVPRISRVDVRVKRGAYVNELTAHRYDVVLHVGGVDVGHDVDDIVVHQADDVADVRALLVDGAPVRIDGFADARSIAEARLAELAMRADGDTSMDLLREMARVENATDPDALYQLADEMGMRAELRPSLDRPGRFDASFVPTGPAWDGRSALPALVTDRPLAAWANDPRRGARIRRLVPALRSFLRGHLPEYMVPQAILVLDSFPLTENGKTDRRSLPAPPQTRTAAGGAYVPPTTDVEAALCALWAELLRVDEVGVDDDFFRLGGHSLLATVLVSRIRERFGVDMPLHRVFQTPTVAGLAAAVDEANEQVLAALLSELDELSDDEARALLALEAEGLTGLTAHE